MKERIWIALAVVAGSILFVIYVNWSTATEPAPVRATPAAAPSRTPAPTARRTVRASVFPTITNTLYWPTRVSETPSPVLTPSATVTLNYSSPITGTPVPPLTAHTWRPSPVLVEIGLPDSPYLVIYADGRVFRRVVVESGHDHKTQIVTIQLGRAQLCSLLNSIDQFGYFDFDSHSYAHGVDLGRVLFDGSMETITVNAWRSKKTVLYELRFFAYEQAGYSAACQKCDRPIFLPSLWNTYWLLENFYPAGLHVYMPDRLAVWTAERVQGGAGMMDWPLKLPTLLDIYQQSPSHNWPYEVGNSIVLRGKAASIIFKLFNYSTADYIWFSYKGDAYRVFVSPLLPYEAAQTDNQSSEFFDRYFPTPAYALSCSPSDGLLPPAQR